MTGTMQKPQHEFQSSKVSEFELANDLLHGAEEIAVFLFGDKAQRRKVYHLVASSRMPVARLGSVLCARRSVLIAWIEDQEQRALGRKATLNSTKD